MINNQFKNLRHNRTATDHFQCEFESRNRSKMSNSSSANVVKRVLFVFHGNICKSPMAQAVMSDLIMAER